MGSASVSIDRFGVTPEGAPVEIVSLDSGAGLTVSVLTLGAILQKVVLADGTDVLLGFDDLAGYLEDRLFLGATVGRYANRIAGAGFSLDGRRYDLPANNGPNTLHGGKTGFDRAVWRIEAAGLEGEGAALTLAHHSPDGDQGFPGALDVTVTFRVEGTRLSLDYRATTTAPTPLSLTSHGYFNLAGAGDILDHVLQTPAERYLPIDATGAPVGPPAPVAGSPFDFRAPQRLGARIDADHPQLAAGSGYDHCYLVARDGPGLALAAVLRHPPSGRTLRVSTTEPGFQLYSGNHLGGDVRGKGGRPHSRRAGVCLETQALPDSPNRPDFPCAILRPGETWTSRTVLEFGVGGSGSAFARG